MIDRSTNIIIVIGLPGVGKTTFCEYFSNIYSYQNINTGKCIREALSSVDTNDKIEWGHTLIRLQGKDSVFSAIASKIYFGGSFILDGIRLFPTYRSFRKNFSNVKIVLITADENLRKTRLKSRILSESAKYTPDHYFKRTGFLSDYAKLKRHADVVIDNSDSIEELLLQIQSISIRRLTIRV